MISHWHVWRGESERPCIAFDNHDDESSDDDANFYHDDDYEDDVDYYDDDDYDDDDVDYDDDYDDEKMVGLTCNA